MIRNMFECFKMYLNKISEWINVENMGKDRM